MRLTSFSDYALRMLMYAASAGDRLITIEEAARTFRVSKAHLNKVVNALTRAGYLRAARGRSGGVALGRPADTICIGDVLRLVEPDFELVECFTSGNQCIIARSCKLSRLLADAMAAFHATLDRHTLADIMLNPTDFLGSEATGFRRPGRAMKATTI